MQHPWVLQVWRLKPFDDAWQQKGGFDVLEVKFIYVAHLKQQSCCTLKWCSSKKSAQKNSEKCNTILNINIKKVEKNNLKI